MTKDRQFVLLSSKQASLKGLPFRIIASLCLLQLGALYTVTANPVFFTIENKQANWRCLYNTQDNNADITTKGDSDQTQHWELKTAGQDGHFYIVNRQTQNALAAPGKNAFTIETYQDDPSATWEFLDIGGGQYYLRNLKSRRYLQVKEQRRGYSVETTSSSAPNNLTWLLEEVPFENASPPPPASGDTETSNATLIFDNGFENNLDQFRTSLAGGTYNVVSSPVAEDSKTAELDLQFESVEANNYRAELTLTPSNTRFDFGKEYWLSMKYRYENWDLDRSTEAAPFQIHDTPADWSTFTGDCMWSAWSGAPFFMASSNNMAKFVTFGGVIRWEGAIQTKKWYTVTIHFMLSGENDGYIEAWIDGVKLFDRIYGQNIHLTDNCGNTMLAPYLKVGVYKWDWKQGNPATDSTRRTIYIDALRIAEGANAYDLVSGNAPMASPTSAGSEPTSTQQYSQYCILKAEDFESFTTEQYDPNKKIILCQMHPHRGYSSTDLLGFERNVKFILSTNIAPFSTHKINTQLNDFEDVRKIESPRLIPAFSGFRLGSLPT